MPRSPDPPTHDPDDGTWQQSAQSDGSTVRAHTTSLSLITDQPTPTHLEPAATPEETPSPFRANDSKDSGDSEETTPKPGAERTDEWDVAPPPTIAKGQVIFGTYLLEEQIGEGGMGQVWRVENIPLQRQSALKLIKPGIAQNDKGWRRFEREARVMAKLTHPNAVHVYAFKRASSMGYIEMEFVNGRSIDKHLAEHEGEPMTLAWTAHVLNQLCAVLQEAHENVDEKKGKPKPIIHRDLKPSNLMLVDKKPPGQNLKVLDFGIAKMVEDDGSPDVTGAGDLVGTPAYMSPEQIRGGYASPEQIRGGHASPKDARGFENTEQIGDGKRKESKAEIDGRSDLYSVGVLLYQFLTGSLPFKEPSKMATLLAHLSSKPRPFKEANPSVRVPPAVEKLVMKCLEKEPGRRPQSARELAEEFQAAAGVITQTQPERRIWQQVAAFAAVAAFLTAMLTLAGPRIGPWINREGSSSSGNLEKKTIVPTVPETPNDGTGGKPVDDNPWESMGFEAIERDRLETIAASKKLSFDYLATELDGAPAGLRGKDNAVFYCFKKGIYLPLGYEPQESTKFVNFWPKVLVRKSDGVVFVWISAGSYRRGDFQPQKPTPDLQGNPCLPHDVALSGFYIQEHEVTNKEFSEYVELNPDVPVKEWRDGCDSLVKDMKKSPEEVQKYPAVLVNRANAQRYAESVFGRLPTEAEWEYVARSQGLDDRWAGQKHGAKSGAPKARLLSTENAGDPVPVEVKSFAGEDETDQGVFDMTGNVREWCLDVYKPYAEIIKQAKKNHDQAAATGALLNPRFGGEPEADDAKVRYVVRGGSFMDQADVAKTFQRDGISADEELNFLGFRVVIECPPAGGGKSAK
jgi:eukaryotic-like serine/threonine-protein kinase